METNRQYSEYDDINGEINKILELHSKKVAILLGGVEAIVVLAAARFFGMPVAESLGAGAVFSDAIEFVSSSVKLKKLRREQENASWAPGSGNVTK
jgi:hypothetical protein